MRASALRVVVAATALASGAAAADIDRGRALYELHCKACHSESVHARKTRKASSFKEVRGWVERWSRHLRTNWSEQELDDVAMHVNGAYYGHPCPPTVCKVVSRLGHALPRPRPDSRGVEAKPG